MASRSTPRQMSFSLIALTTTNAPKAAQRPRSGAERVDRNRIRGQLGYDGNCCDRSADQAQGAGH